MDGWRDFKEEPLKFQELMSVTTTNMVTRHARMSTPCPLEEHLDVQS